MKKVRLGIFVSSLCLLAACQGATSFDEKAVERHYRQDYPHWTDLKVEKAVEATRQACQGSINDIVEHTLSRPEGDMGTLYGCPKRWENMD